MSRQSKWGHELHPDNAANYPAYVDDDPRAITRVGEDEWVMVQKICMVEG